MRKGLPMGKGGNIDPALIGMMTANLSLVRAHFGGAEEEERRLSDAIWRWLVLLSLSNRPLRLDDS